MPRSHSVDVLRGFALLGIGIVNLPHLALPMSAALSSPDSAVDFWAKGLVSLFFEGKFFVLFSFLFGWGFGVQLASAANDQVPAGPPYRARLIALAIFGIFHALLVFHGDILLAYAILGGGLWMLRNSSPQNLLRIALMMLPIAAAAFAALAFLNTVAEEMASNAFDMGGEGYRGSYTQAVAQRLTDWPVGFVVVALFNGPLAFGAFCVGLAAYKIGLFENDSLTQAALARQVPILIAVALPANTLYAAATLGLLPDGWITFVGYSALAVGAPALAAIYVAAVLRLGPWLGALAPSGSMPLTGYIAQSLIAGAVFHGWGLGLFGNLGNAALLGVACLIWMGVTAAAMLWKLRWSRGPLDAALRSTVQGLSRIGSRS